MNEITINKINQFLDDVIKETSASLDTEFDHVVCHLDDQMTALEELEMKIGQVIVAIDDLRGLIITLSLSKKSDIDMVDYSTR